MSDSDFAVGFKQGQSHGKQLILEKVQDAIADIQTNIDSMETNAKLHEQKIRENGEYIAIGMRMALDILNDKFGEELENEVDSRV